MIALVRLRRGTLRRRRLIIAPLTSFTMDLKIDEPTLRCADRRAGVENVSLSCPRAVFA